MAPDVTDCRERGVGGASPSVERKRNVRAVDDETGQATVTSQGGEDDAVSLDGSRRPRSRARRRHSPLLTALPLTTSSAARLPPLTAWGWNMAANEGGRGLIGEMFWPHCRGGRQGVRRQSCLGTGDWGLAATRRGCDQRRGPKGDPSRPPRLRSAGTEASSWAAFCAAAQAT